MPPHPANFLIFFVETEFHHVSHAGLELNTPFGASDLPTLASQSAGITGTSCVHYRIEGTAKVLQAHLELGNPEKDTFSCQTFSDETPIGPVRTRAPSFRWGLTLSPGLVRSRLSATSTFQVQGSLLPQPPKPPGEWKESYWYLERESCDGRSHLAEAEIFNGEMQPALGDLTERELGNRYLNFALFFSTSGQLAERSWKLQGYIPDRPGCKAQSKGNVEEQMTPHSLAVMTRVHRDDRT
ncbi:hypothetical protein AAY473_022603 [Plecturocebus cupreus]